MMTAAPYCPITETDVVDALADALRDGARVAIRGGGTKRDIGAPAPHARELDMRGLTGVVDYDPAELILTVKPGMAVSEVNALVASERQSLAFEPFDHGPIYGRRACEATIGGIVAAGVSGSQRPSHGGARDHVLGLRAVSGRGEVFVSGAKVVKNVTGYDLPKLITGSWGRLAVMTEVTLKVLPAPMMKLTCVLRGLNVEQAVAAMAAAMGSQAEVAAAAHRPHPVPMTAFRLQGFEASVVARAALLAKKLASFGPIEHVSESEADAYWSDLCTLESFPVDLPIWRVSLPPSASEKLVRHFEPQGAHWMLDWGGGLAWLAIPEDAELRSAVEDLGGHAMLIRASQAFRISTPAFHPQPVALAKLEERIRRAFDPACIFETGRF